MQMTTIYVGNLPFEGTTEQAVRDCFAEFGDVAKVTFVHDRDTGEFRGFAFIEMPDDREAQYAISTLNGTKFNGRALRVNEAKPKPVSVRSPRGNGGGNGGNARHSGHGYATRGAFRPPASWTDQE